MSWLWYFYALLSLLSAFRLRKRLRAVSPLPPAPGFAGADAILLIGQGISVDPATRTAASAWAAGRHLELLDILPANTGVIELMRFFDRVDPVAYRANRIGIGCTAGYALLATKALVEQTGVDPFAPASLYVAARSLKSGAMNHVDFVMAPTFQSPPPNPSITDPAGFSALLGRGARFNMMFQAVVLLFLIAGFFVNPVAAGTALAFYHLQPFFAIAGLPFRPRDFWTVLLLRSPLEVWLLLRHLLARKPDTVVSPELRESYAAKIANGLDTFFESRREDCPFCGSRDIRPHIRTTDLFQRKPGRFVLDRCRACGHVFQNPRLTLRGLDYYYADFYDGLGASDMERIFGAGPEAYGRRLKTIRRLAQPRRWLDVGAAHGHFCCYAKGEMPETQFDGLEMSAAIEDAVRSRWVDHGYRGVFPDIAPQIASQYDVVSSFHCLEHVPDPGLEIQAAYTTLAPGGFLLIEVPNPECQFGSIFGRFWMPWLQPQHLNMYSSKNLCELLRRHGFEPLHVEGSSSERQFDILASVLVFLGWLAPKTGFPWQPKPAFWSGIRHNMVWGLGFPFVMLAFAADRLFAPLFRRLKFDSSYRVIARKPGASLEPELRMYNTPSTAS